MNASGRGIFLQILTPIKRTFFEHLPLPIPNKLYIKQLQTKKQSIKPTSSKAINE